MSQLGSTKKPKWRKVVVALMTVVIGLESGWIGMSQAIAPNRIDPSEAQRFFVQLYYPSVLQDPLAALNRWGTTQFRAQKEATGVKDYTSWYRGTSAIPPGHTSVVRHNEEPYLFEVSFERILKSGAVKHQKVRVIFGLECVNTWQAHVPWRRCEAENLRINYSARVPPLV
jgi:hypothetical protein